MKTKHAFLSRRAKTLLLLLSITAFAGIASGAASGGSLTEVLEQGIYTEETKGDIDAAMQLYQQVVADTKAGEALAAQAQYRLGVCHYKKKNFAEATAAFEKLVKEYPDQKELVRLANEYLAGAAALLPAPWVDGEELRLDVKFATGVKIGVASYTANAGELDGKKIWRVGSHLFAGAQQWSRAEVEADSFKPIHSRWKHDLLGDADAVYGTDKVELRIKGKEGVKSFDISNVLYDNEEAIQLMRRLPLASNYTTTIRIFASLGGGNIIPLKLETTGPEKVTVPAGTFDCYKVELSIKQTFWYSADEHRYLVKFEAGGVMAELTGINQRKPGERTQYRNAQFQLSLTVPPGWIVDEEKSDDEKKVGLLILDPEALTIGNLGIQGTNNLNAEQAKSLRSWAESDMAKAKNMLKDFKIRSDSWKDRKVSGYPAVSVLADYTDGQEKKVGYSVYVFAGANALKFTGRVGADDLEKLQPSFDSIIDSLKAN